MSGYAGGKPSESGIAKRGLHAIKICAVTTARDAEMVTSIACTELPPHVQLLIGMILWPGSRRSVTPTAARQIASIAKDAGACPVAVFVDENVARIRHTCAETGVPVAQLHGPACREAWRNCGMIPGSWIDVRDVSVDGQVSPATVPIAANGANIDPVWTVFDAKGGGTGRPFDWNTFTPPTSQQWLLAGGLDPHNVADAVRALRPVGLDVATGVAAPDKIRKDRGRVREFIQRAIDAYY